MKQIYSLPIDTIVKNFIIQYDQFESVVCFILSCTFIVRLSYPPILCFPIHSIIHPSNSLTKPTTIIHRSIGIEFIIHLSMLHPTQPMILLRHTMPFSRMKCKFPMAVIQPLDLPSSCPVSSLMVQDEKDSSHSIQLYSTCFDSVDSIERRLLPVIQFDSDIGLATNCISIRNHSVIYIRLPAYAL